MPATTHVTSEAPKPAIEPGVLLIDKPYGWSSHDVVNVVRKVTGEKRVGHAGTLDPLATGLLVILVGRDATRKQDQFMAGEKAYAAHVVFGVESDTDDVEGPLRMSAANETMRASLTEEAVRNILPQFLGTTQQQAPAYSAIQVGGKRLYAEARKGTLNTADLPMREITIDAITLSSFTRPTSDAATTTSNNDVQSTLAALNTLTETRVERDKRAEKDSERVRLARQLETQLPCAALNITCQKGTYIRALARDMGHVLQTGATLSGLRRTQVGRFSIDQAVTVYQLHTGDYTLIPLDQAL